MFGKIMNGFIIGAVALIMALIIFSVADESYGTKTTYPERVTVTDTRVSHIKTKYSMITKYYITVKTETGTEEIQVAHDFYNKVEKNDEIEVIKTIIETKFTHDTVIKYEVN